MYVICREETESVLRAAVKSLKEILVSHCGINIEQFVAEWFWDGKTEAEKVFNDEFSARGHMCLQHGKKHIKARCTGGFKTACPLMIDMLAFLPRFAFHISAELLLQQLAQAGP